MRQIIARIGIAAVACLTIALAGCGGATLSPEQQATATAGAALATFAAQPPPARTATMAAVMATIDAGLK